MASANSKSGRQKNYHKHERGLSHNAGRRATKHERYKHELSESEKRRVVQLWSEGYSNRQIAVKCGLTREMVEQFSAYGYQDFMRKHYHKQEGETIG